MSVAREAISKALSAIKEPQLDRSLVELGMIREVRVDGSTVNVQLRLSNPDYPRKEAVSLEIRRVLGRLDGVEGVHVDWHVESAAQAPTEDNPVPGAKHIVLVMSGKGGVGKSTVATNLALALSRRQFKVGLLDADMYGPSIPTMLGISGRPLSTGNRIVPLSRFDVKLMSIGFLLDDEKAAVVWRGPMLHGALLQFLKDVDWGELDYLLLDLPPGTGDIALTLSQRVRATGAVIVTTPQEVALQDVYKSVSMAKKVGIPILGIVENQSYFICDQCSARHELYGAGGGQRAADFAEAPLLGQIPIDGAIRQWGDAGTPVVQASPGSESAKALISVADRLVERIDVLSGPRTVDIDRSGGINRHLPITR